MGPARLEVSPEGVVRTCRLACDCRKQGHGPRRKEYIMKTSRKARNGSKVIRIMSFGFKPGAPPSDAALTIDCRGLTNPHYVDELRAKTGPSRAVAEFLKADREVQALLG